MVIKILILLKADYWYTTKQECKDTDFDLVERVTGIFFQKFECSLTSN